LLAWHHLILSEPVKNPLIQGDPFICEASLIGSYDEALHEEHEQGRQAEDDEGIHGQHERRRKNRNDATNDAHNDERHEPSMMADMMKQMTPEMREDCRKMMTQCLQLMQETNE